MGLDTRSVHGLLGDSMAVKVEHGLAILDQFEPGQVAYLRSCGNPMSLFRAVRDAEATPRILRVSSTSANSIATIQLKLPSCSRMKSPIGAARSRYPPDRTFLPVPLLRLYRGTGSALAELQDRLETLAGAPFRMGRAGLANGFWMSCVGSGQRRSPSWKSS